MPVKLVFVFAKRQAWIKGRNKKMPVKLVFVFCALIEKEGTKILDLACAR